jgi:WD40 repeat protein
MASTLNASPEGLEVVDRERRKKGWNKAEVAWQVQADVSKSTLDRFWMQKPIKQQNFVAICLALGISDWQQVADLPPIASVPVRRGSNLGQVSEPVILELDGFAQRIFDWFKALEFDRESDPRREGNYVEWVIKVVMRSRVDRVLIRAIIHEAGLGDLDGLRRSVADLRVDEGWLVTSLWVSPSVKQVLNKSQEGLTCLTFDELIDQDANFAPYLAWLEAEVRRRELEKYYVPLGCTKGEFDGVSKTLRAVNSYPVSEGGIDLYIDRWLENPMNEHVSVLGEFGTGKTWFVLHYAGRCLRAYLEAKQKGLPRPRLPLVIPLRDYAKALNVENVLAGFFYTQHNIRLNSAVFDRLNQMGKLLLIFDGFDEMADKVDHQKMIDNFWELAKVVTTNAKVILTCRTEHFPTAQVGRDTLWGELLASTARLTGVPPQFETLELMKFDDVQIREVLGRRTNEVTVQKVMGNGQVLDLLRRAVMAEFVLAALPEIEAGKEIDLARVYLYAVRRQMEENITTGRTFTSLADKLYFLCELSWEMLSTDRMSLNYREFPDLLRKFFGAEVESQKDLDHWHYDMMGQTMLVRNDDGDYSPAHRSLLEFFVAYKFAAELGMLAQDFIEMAQEQSGIDETLESQYYGWSNYWQRDIDQNGNRKLIAPLTEFKRESTKRIRDTFGIKPLTKVIIDLLLLLLNRNSDYQSLIELIKSTKGQTLVESRYLGGNSATLLVKMDRFSLNSQDFSKTNLSYSNLVGAGLMWTNLVEANLENCLTTKVFGSVNSILITKDDLKIITAHDDNTIRIWDRNSGREIHKLIGHKGDINCLAMNKNDEMLYSGSGDLTIKEWKLSDGVCQRTFQGHHDFVAAIRLSKDEEFLYSGSNDLTIKEWKVSDGICQRTLTGHQGLVRTIALSDDGQFLYSGSNDGTIKEWTLSNGICKRVFESHQDLVISIALDYNKGLLYSGGNDGSIKEWRLVDGICQRVFKGHQDWVSVLTLSECEKFLYSGGHDRIIKEWRLSDGICQQTFTGYQDWLKAIALSNDKKMLYSGSNDGIIKEWSLSDGVCQQVFEGHQNLVSSVSLCEDNYSLYFGTSDGAIREFLINPTIKYKKAFYGHNGFVMAIAVSENRKLIYSGGSDGLIKEWSILDGTCLKTFYGHQNLVRTIVVSTNGKFIYSGSSDGTVKKWNTIDGQCCQTLKGHHNSVRSIALSRNEDFIYSGSSDGTIKKWETSTGICKNTFKGHKNIVKTISLSDDGDFLYSGSSDNTIKQWKTSNGTCVKTFEGHTHSVSAIILSKDGELIYSGSSDCLIYEWSIANSNIQRVFEGHESSVRAISMNSDESRLYSGSDDGTIKIWDIKSGICVSMIDPRLCAGANITGVKGLTPAQTDALIALGAFDDNRK